MRISYFSPALLMVALALPALASSDDQPASTGRDALDTPAGQEAQPAAPNPEAELAAQQKRIESRFDVIHKLFADLAQFEREFNPRRAELLDEATKRSNVPKDKLQETVVHLERKDLKKALASQAVTIQELEELLALLKQEDRGERIKSERQRIKEYIKEIERLNRIQRALRGQNEGGADAPRLAKGQEGVADRTKSLDQQIQRDNSIGGREGKPSPSLPQAGSEGKTEGKSEGDPKGKSDGDSSGDSKGENKGNSEGENKGDSQGNSKGDSEGNSKGDSEGESKGDSEGDSKGDSEGESKGDSEGNSKGDSEGESKGDSEGNSKGDSEGNSKGDSEGNSKGDSEGDSKGDSQGDSQGNSEGGSPGSRSSQPQSEQNPVRKRIQAAEEKMREAQRKLEQAKRDDSIRAQRDAERELELAKKELEQILRQLREEEVERMLAMLEGRFRRMLESQVKVYEATRRLHQVSPEQRNREFDINAGKQSFEQRKIASDADRALVLLLEDGSSIAFPETVQQMSEDMKQVANRLARAQVGQLTQGIEEDVIATLEDLITALVKAQEEMDDQPPPDGQAPPAGAPQDQPLVDVIAELKMIRGLQARVNTRHLRYARQLEDPDDLVGQTADPDMQRAIGRLADREQKIKQITQDIVLGKNR